MKIKSADGYAVLGTPGVFGETAGVCFLDDLHPAVQADFIAFLIHKKTSERLMTQFYQRWLWNHRHGLFDAYVTKTIDSSSIFELLHLKKPASEETGFNEFNSYVLSNI